jgi:uncharacterized caspase-like protein
MFVLPALLLVAGASSPDPGERRFALVVGNQEGGSGTRPLHYADRDARRIDEILLRLGGVQSEDNRLLIDQDAAHLRAALGELFVKAEQARASGQTTWLFFYYSGHAKDGELRLGGTTLAIDELRHSLEAAPADVRVGLIDSCQSGAITRAKGVRAAPAFDVQKAVAPKGLVLIASSAANEESQESDSVDGSFFTHYLASGLLGDADENGDGKVTLAEAYAYAYGRTVGSTVDTTSGTQHPVYLYDLGGAGDLVLTEPSPARGGLLFGEKLAGDYVILDSRRKAIAEVAKPAGSVRQLALPPGQYLLKKPDGDGLLVGEISVGDGLTDVQEDKLRRVSLEKDPQKGASGPEVSLSASVGYQAFFDAAANSGLFPPMLLGGVAVAVRQSLGHEIGWGGDLSFGAGNGTLVETGLPGIPFNAQEVSAGVEIWKDFDVWILRLGIGLRIAGILLLRQFEASGGLPNQNFFTLTPGLEATISTPIAGHYSAFLRGRLNYLFYNIDGNQSLGYGEVDLGVSYAFGD